MTERWRKKLGDLDKQGPSDDVFDRAKNSSVDLDREPLTGLKTSTRVVTAAVAFAVFALAISVFAIPALRMHPTQAGSSTGGMFPLWPSQTTDQLEQLQADVDAGNAGWALDPKDVATTFGRQVLGWSDVKGLGPQPACGIDWSGSSGYTSAPPNSSAPTLLSACRQDVIASAASDGPASSLPGPDPSGSGSMASSGVVQVFITDCLGAQSCVSSESVFLYQPLDQGPGQIWAVLFAQSSWMTLSTVPGQLVRAGASVGGTFIGGGDLTPTLGYASCDVSRASSQTEEVPGLGERITIRTDPSSASCSGPQPGYVWAVRTSGTLADPSGAPSQDPISGGAHVVLGITAVPVTMVFSDEQATPPPSNGGTEIIPTPTPSNGSTTAWESFTGDLEWTMDVPSGWQSKRIAATSVTGSGGSGDEFTGDGLTVDIFRGTDIAMPADDSRFPLDYDSLLTEQNDGALVGTFRGDGFPLNIRIAPDGSQVTAEQEAILRHMVASIAFPHIQPGDILAVHVALADPVAQDQWMKAAGGTYILRSTSDGYIALGPVTCREDGQVHTQWDPSQTCPDSVNLAQWSANGTPATGNAPGFQDPLSVHPVIRAWDGTLLTLLEFGGVAGQDTSAVPSPSPTP